MEILIQVYVSFQVKMKNRRMCVSNSHAFQDRAEHAGNDMFASRRKRFLDTFLPDCRNEILRKLYGMYDFYHGRFCRRVVFRSDCRCV